MIYVIKLSKHCALFPGISKFRHIVLDSLHSSGKAAAALFEDAAFVPGEFIEDGAWQYQLNIPHADELFKCGQNRLLLIVLRKIEPNAGIDKNLKQAVFLPSADRRHSLWFLRPLISISVKNEITKRHGRIDDQGRMVCGGFVFANVPVAHLVTEAG